jgi:hypothetical protein
VWAVKSVSSVLTANKVVANGWMEVLFYGLPVLNPIGHIHFFLSVISLKNADQQG